MKLKLVAYKVQLAHLVISFELLSVEVKVPAQSSYSEERTQQCRLVRHKHCAVRVLLVLGLQLV